MKRRNTPSKEAVLNLLINTKKALSHDVIVEKLKITIDRATIYRVLNRFCEDGLVHKIIAEDGKLYFAVCIACDKEKHSDNHLHFRCSKCQMMECLHEPVQFTLPSGFHVNSINCVLTGTCSDCS